MTAGLKPTPYIYWKAGLKACDNQLSVLTDVGHERQR